MTLFSLILALAACGDDKDNQDTSEDSKKILTVESSGIYPPFISVDAAGKAQGYEYKKTQQRHMLHALVAFYF